MNEQERRDWHRLFGLFLRDHLTDQPFTVEAEIDVSLQEQLLDVVIVRMGNAPTTIQLPDGFDDLAAYNLISFKSHREALDDVAMDELVGYYMSYWKQVSPTSGRLPANDFRLFALSARYPRDFARGRTLRTVAEGVYAIDSFSKEIRIVVIHDLPREKQNAVLHLFSAHGRALDFARKHYLVRSNRPSGLIAQLLGRYVLEGIEMPFDAEKWLQEELAKTIATLPPEQRLAGLTPEQRLEFARSLSPEQRVEVAKTLPPEQRVEVAKTLPLEQRLSGLTVEQLEEFLQRMKADPK